MGNRYNWLENPFQDYLFKLLMIGVDISSEKHKNEINVAFTYILENYLINKKDVIYLDFEIIGNKDYFKVIGKNSVSALWLCGIVPDDTEFVLRNNSFLIEDLKYVYNQKTCKLTYKKKNG